MASAAYGAGIGVPFYSTDAASTADSNGVEAKSPAVMVTNPAGLTYLSDTWLENNLFIMQPRFRYFNGRGYYFRTHEPIQGSNSGEVGHRIEIPSTFISHRFNNKIVGGMAIYAPFGADFTYPLDSVMRYNGNRIRLMTVMFNPNIAFKIAPHHSIGLGVYALASKAKLRQFADETEPLNVYARRFLPFIFQGKDAFRSGTFEIYATPKGWSVSYGYNLSWLWDVTPDFRLGVSYRSRSHSKLHGTSQWFNYSSTFNLPLIGSVMDYGQQILGFKNKEKVNFYLDYPDLWQLQAQWKISDQLKLFANYSYSHDSVKKSLHIDWERMKIVPDASTDTPNVTASNYSEIALNFKDSWRLGLGGSYHVSKPLELRFGVTYMSSSARGPKGRSAVTPDNDTYLIGLGGNYQYSKNLIFGFSYNYLKLKNAKVAATSYCGGSLERGLGALNCVDSRGHSFADTHSDAHTLGLGFKYRLN